MKVLFVVNNFYAKGNGLSGSARRTVRKLKEAGFNVIDENVKSLWNPSEEDFSKIPELVTSLLAE